MCLFLGYNFKYKHKYKIEKKRASIQRSIISLIKTEILQLRPSYIIHDFKIIIAV